MTVKTLFSAANYNLATCFPDTPLKDVVDDMVQRKENAVCVINEDKSLAGIVTDHDVMRALAKNHGKLDDATVASWMTSHVITCDCDTKLSAALKLMGRHKIRHLIAVENNRPVAIIGIRAALAKIHEDDEMEINVLRDITTAKSA